MVRHSSASCGKSLALLEALKHVVCVHRHSAALSLQLFAARYRTNSSTFRLSNIIVNDGDQHGNREKARWDDRHHETTADALLHPFQVFVTTTHCFPPFTSDLSQHDHSNPIAADLTLGPLPDFGYPFADDRRDDCFRLLIFVNKTGTRTSCFDLPPSFSVRNDCG
jgi:hypothetical protein